MLKELEKKTEVDSVSENEYNYSRKSPNLLTKSNIRKRPAQRTIPKTVAVSKVFLPYDEKLSEANELATRWAHREDINVGTKRFYRAEADGI